MMVSGGISEINLTSGTYGPQKVYLWPVYNAGKVDPIFRITRELDGKAHYSKPTPEEKERLLSDMKKKGFDTYSVGSNRVKNSPYSPGTFFDACV